ncbi:acetate/propionate family kinase [Chamaesiphon polymorphus]|uniref:Acetate kinase n=1 Tax=Chamaesiphon polymorphus CCALA 037 TaxID=2107692 RepID=A0A2T1GAZ9_9CYAN|nr:acetate kinase [Chamaesiphon polymorphus]PSB54475.1 acetate kinase [Chamaesiphon polymorphus CCALA 037]
MLNNSIDILVLNAGSSSFKSRLYRLTQDNLPLEPVIPLWTGEIEWSSSDTAILKAKTTDDAIEEERTQANRTADIHDLLGWLSKGKTQVIQDITQIDIVGNRIVHGGEKYRQPTFITAEVKAEIDRLSIYAPLHNPANLMGIDAIESLSPNIPQLAVFDTAFYRDLPEVAYVYPVPYQWLERGIRKYGFHGISHEYCTRRAAELLGYDLQDLRLISCHLGNGCSLAAVAGGRCIETTMGFTPLDGLMMGTRCGSIDPGIILHLVREGEYTIEELDRALNFESGLLGVSGVSNDLREIDKAITSGNQRAKLALDMYIDRLTARIAALVPALGGVDALIFTGGVGEHQAGIRAAVATKLAFLGVEIDPDFNNTSIPPDRDLATDRSSVRLLAIHTQEEWQIATACWQYLIDRNT